MKRMLTLLLSGLFIILAGYSVWQVLNKDTSELKVGGQPHFINDKNIGEMEVTTLTGDQEKLKHKLTADINIINFWASWCEPCNKEMPELVRYDEMKPNHIKLIGLNVQDKNEGRQSFLKKYKPDYPIVIGTEEMIRKYRIYNIPTTVFVAKDGQVLMTYVGELDVYKIETLIQQIERR
ncbi:TlpA family protein disulfide reductase [Macrococcus carouselicus]|uniref:TlpA family protein disulfide reductase n=1 Tax=Macrococcus carouselicus TaxID=69969 RepID=A0A9Q8FQ50_9STAP|nr:TlpA disulfide reductase family protein [Macrococcus carouselicus]TDM03682.1 TlpA family protein disulfide reductase [Macrococcus carouselicus]